VNSHATGNSRGGYDARHRIEQIRRNKASAANDSDGFLLTVKIRQPSHEFTFGVGITFVSYSLVLTPVV
jgi:hypothetical protein